MKITKKARSQAKRLFRLCLRDGVPDPAALRQAIAFLSQKRPRGYLAILLHLQRMLQLDQERRTAVIESASPLESSVRSNIQSTLERRYGAGLTFRFEEKPGLLAGLRAQIGSDVYDGTVWTRLNNVRQAFGSNGQGDRQHL